YALSDGEWSRILVPSDEAAVSVNSFDPQTGEYRVERYLLGSEAMARARSARADYQAPACGAGPDAARALGISQQAVRATLPASPNERLVYRCTKAP
ncbi:MAG: serine protease, partial [Porphyrobacter sp.]|nr:serine protease [Porphyrobacter sp.]